MKAKLGLSLSLLIILLSPAYSSGQQRTAMPKRGMTKLEVINLLGGPEEKIEKEIKRRDIWQYKDKVAVFDNGKLEKLTDKKGRDLLGGPLSEEGSQTAAKNQRKQTPIANQDVVDDILTEIMKDPSNAEPPDPRPVHPPVIQPNVINPVPPPEIIN